MPFSHWKPFPESSIIILDTASVQSPKFDPLNQVHWHHSGGMYIRSDFWQDAQTKKIKICSIIAFRTFFFSFYNLIYLFILLTYLLIHYLGYVSNMRNNIILQVKRVKVNQQKLPQNHYVNEPLSTEIFDTLSKHQSSTTISF